jgi:hypothetical protein
MPPLLPKINGKNALFSDPHTLPFFPKVHFSNVCYSHYRSINVPGPVQCAVWTICSCCPSCQPLAVSGKITQISKRKPLGPSNQTNDAGVCSPRRPPGSAGCRPRIEALHLKDRVPPAGCIPHSRALLCALCSALHSAEERPGRQHSRRVRGEQDTDKDTRGKFFQPITSVNRS